MIRRRCAAVVWTLSFAAFPVIAQSGVDKPAAPVAERGLTRAEIIDRAVERMNARAVAPPPGVGESGDQFIWEGPAAWTARSGIPGLGDTCRVHVVLLSADLAGAIADVSEKLMADTRIASVTAVNVTSVTPTPQEVAVFDSMLVWTNAIPLDNDALGDTLANFEEEGGGVVLSMFAMRASLESRTIGGRFLAANYYAIEHSVGASTTGPAGIGFRPVVGSPILAGVTTFGGGNTSSRSPAGLNPFATRVANWSTGEILVATRDDLAGRRVDLGFWPVSSSANSAGWIATTDGARLMANALVHAGGCPNVGTAGCSGAVVAFPPDPTQGGVFSNAPSNEFITQQEADDFSVAEGATIRRITLWGFYGGGLGNVPACQRFLLNIHADQADDPGAIVYAAAPIVVPEYTGEHVTPFFGTPRLYRFTIDLDPPFSAAPGVKYWLSPLGNNAENVWAWHLSDGSTASRRFRRTPADAWEVGPGTFAFNLCGEHCIADFNSDGVVNSQDYFDFLAAFFSGC